MKSINYRIGVWRQVCCDLFGWKPKNREISLNPKTQKLLDKANRHISAGKLALALYLYQEIHDLDPSETMTISTIADIYIRQGKKEDALVWYQKAAALFESTGRDQNAIVILRKMVEISPRNVDLMGHLAHLLERSGQIPRAKAQYQMIVGLLKTEVNLSQIINLYNKICDIDPLCSDARWDLAWTLKKAGRTREAADSFLQFAELQIKRGNFPRVGDAIEEIFLLCPHDIEYVKRFFILLHKIGLIERGVKLIFDFSYDQDMELKILRGDALIEEGKIEQARKILLASPPTNPQLFKTTTKLLQELVIKKEVQASLDAMNLLLDISIRLHEESNLMDSLKSVLELDPSNLRALNILTTLQIRINDLQDLGENLKQMAFLQLKANDYQGAHDSLNKLVIHDKMNSYLDDLNLVHEAIECQSAFEAAQIGGRVILNLGKIRKAKANMIRGY